MEDTIDYKPFFGLLEEPFNTVASPRFFYLSPIHAIALNKSVFTVDNRKGVSVVWGDIGTGKSTLARIMHERFLNKGYVSVLLTNPGYISKNALIRTINEGFKVGRLKPSFRGGYFLSGIWPRRSPRPRSIASNTTA